MLEEIKNFIFNIDYIKVESDFIIKSKKIITKNIIKS
jgi:hypothetical protein